MADCVLADFVAGYRAGFHGSSFDLVDRADAGQKVGGQRCWLGCVDIEYLAPEMRPAGNLGDTVGGIKLVVASIGIGLQVAGKTCQFSLGVRARAIGRKLVPDKRRAGGSRAAIINRIDPQSCRGCLAATWIKDRYGRVVGMDLRCLEAFATNAADDGIEESRGLADPACKG